MGVMGDRHGRIAEHERGRVHTMRRGEPFSFTDGEHERQGGREHHTTQTRQGSPPTPAGHWHGATSRCGTGNACTRAMMRVRASMRSAAGARSASVIQVEAPVHPHGHHRNRQTENGS